MQIKIERGIEIPKRPFYDDLVKMKLEDSFTFPESSYSNLRSCLQDIKKLYPHREFKTKSISETERRIWRTR